MVERTRITLLQGALASAVLPALAGCVGPDYDAPPYGGYPPYYYDYYYYPYSRVYFHIHSGHYYYHDHGRWWRARRLPRHIRLDRRRHLLRIREKDPWRRHDEHRRRFLPQPDRRGEDGPAGSRLFQRRSEPEPRREEGPAGSRLFRRRDAPEQRRQEEGPAGSRLFRRRDDDDRHSRRERMTPPRRAEGPRERRRGQDDDREERAHNRRRHDEYRGRPWPQRDN